MILYKCVQVLRCRKLRWRSKRSLTGVKCSQKDVAVYFLFIKISLICSRGHHQRKCFIRNFWRVKIQSWAKYFCVFFVQELFRSIWKRNSMPKSFANVMDSKNEVHRNSCDGFLLNFRSKICIAFIRFTNKLCTAQR